MSNIPPEQRLDAWQATFGKAHAIATEKPSAFNAELSTVAVDAMLVHRMTATVQSVQRTPDMIRRDGMDHFVLHLCSSAMNVSTHDRDIAIPGGAVSVNDLAQPYARSAAPERQSVSLIFPRDIIAGKLAATDGLHGVVLQQGAGALMIAHMQALAEGARYITREGAAAAAEATAELFAACVLSTPDNIARARAPLEAAALMRAKRFIELNLADRNLSPERVGGAINVSRATLFRLFAPLGGVAHYIQDRRLTLVRRELARRHGHQTIAEIGYKFGFGSDVHLSRAFRRKFGLSPTEIRPFGERAGFTTTGGSDRIIENWIAEYG